MINSPEQLRPAEQFFKKGQVIDPALLTHGEYVELVDGDKWHEDDTYKATVATLNRYERKHKKLLQRLSVGELDLELYKDTTQLSYTKWLDDEFKQHRPYTPEEIQQAGLPTEAIELYLYHEGKVVAQASDEWGATLILVAREYRGMGLGELLMTRFRKIHPDRSSGGFTSAGRRNFQKVHLAMVREYMRNGIYSALVRKGELTKERVMEILRSVGYHDRKPKAELPLLARYYKTHQADIRLLRYSDTDFVLFDSRLEHIFRHEDAEGVRFRKIVGFVSLGWVNSLNQYVIRHSYADTPAQHHLLLRAALSSVMHHDQAGAVVRHVDPQTIAVLQAGISKGVFKKSRGKDQFGEPVSIIKIAQPLDLEEYYSLMDAWFRTHDPHEEFLTNIIEAAYSKGEDVKIDTGMIKNFNHYVTEAYGEGAEQEAEPNTDIQQGDYVDFGAYGSLYVCDDNYSQDYYWTTEEESDRFNNAASGWAVSKDAAEQVIQRGEEVDAESYTRSHSEPSERALADEAELTELDDDDYDPNDDV